MIDLSNITLWSGVWTDDTELLARTLKVLKHCQKLCNFGAVVLFSKNKFACDLAKWRIIQTPELDAKSWNRFINFEVPKHISTAYAMSVHEDGFILEPSLWRHDFLAYDYIGAPWPDGVVGNGGFCIESRKMLNEKVKLPQDGRETQPSDVFICRTHRLALRQAGVRFAPLHLALRFSTEQTGHAIKSFGFHGRTAIPHKYKLGWQLIENTP